MIAPRIGVTPKLLLIFDTCQSESWITQGKISEKGIEPFMRQCKNAGIDFTDVFAVCLSDTFDKPKKSDYQAKHESIQEFIDTYGFNLIMPIGAGAFERVVEKKGAAKFFGKLLHTESNLIAGAKVLPCPNPSMVKHNPDIAKVIDATFKLAKTEMEFPDIRGAEKTPVDYRVVDTLEKFAEFYQTLKAAPVFAYDLETTGFQHNKDEILTIQFSHEPFKSFLIPCKTVADWSAAPNPWSDSEWEEIVAKLADLFADPSKMIIGHNKKFDDKFIKHHWGIPLQKGRSWDTMIASFMCDENSPNDLKYLACTLTDMGDYEEELDKFKAEYCKKNKMKMGDFTYGYIPFEILAPYALSDTDATIRLYHHFKTELVKEDVEKPFNICMRITWLLTRFELNGWGIDTEYGERLKEELTGEIAELEEALMGEDYIKKAEVLLSAAKLMKDNAKRKKPLECLKEPFVFNFNSTDQKRVLFFEIMKLPIVKRTKKKKPATDKEAQSTWMREQPEHRDFLRKLIRLSEMRKFLSTYVIGVLEKTVNGRVHPTFNAIGAKTGRTSSSSPNLQNIPARGDEEKKKLVKRIKRLFKAPEGRLILGADLSAIEMRVACIVSGDSKLTEIFNNGLDIHGAIAKELFDYITCPINEVKEKYNFERDSVAKTVQFLSIYGGGGDALQKKVNESVIERQEMAKAKGESVDLKEITRDAADEILDDYFRKYFGVARYIEITSEFARKNGYVKSLYGYKRRVPEVGSEDEGVKSRAVRQAVNATVQNPASVMLLLALCDFQDEIDQLGLPYDLISSCHDAGYAEVPVEELIKARDMLLHYMTQSPVENCPIPITAEAEYGQAWSDFSKDFGTALVDAEEEVDEEEEEIDLAA